MAESGRNRVRVARGDRSSRCVLARVLMVALVTLVLTSCGAGTSSPTGPTPNPNDGANVQGLQVECQPTLLVGERSPCIAVARLRSGGTQFVSVSATWSAAAPAVASVDVVGVVTGRSAGEATITSTYQGHSAHAAIRVVAEDGLRIVGALDQGDFAPGATVTMHLQGYYSVASAETGRLSLRISDQDGIVTQTPATTVSRGGDSFVLSSTFAIPASSYRVCRAAVLQVGGSEISAPEPSTLLVACVPVRR